MYHCLWQSSPFYSTFSFSITRPVDFQPYLELGLLVVSQMFARPPRFDGPPFSAMPLVAFSFLETSISLAPFNISVLFKQPSDDVVKPESAVIPMTFIISDLQPPPSPVLLPSAQDHAQALPTSLPDLCDWEWPLGWDRHSLWLHSPPGDFVTRMWTAKYCRRY